MSKEAKEGTLKLRRGRNPLADRRFRLRRWWLLLAGLLLVGCVAVSEGELTRQVDQAAKSHELGKLVDYLEHPKAPIRARAIYHLTRHTGKYADRKRIARQLKGFLKTASELWRREVLVGLLSTRRHDPQTHALLHQLCEDEDITIRMAVLVDLGHRKHLDKGLWGCLLKGMQDKDKILSRMAQLSLKQQSWRSLRPLLRGLLRAPKQHIERFVGLLRELTGYHWSDRASWKRWLESGKLRLFELRYTGRWPAHKEELQKALRSPLLRKEAARLLVRIAPPKEGLQMLLTSQGKHTIALASLWGKDAVQHALKYMARQPRSLSAKELLIFGALLEPSNYNMLSPYLNAERPDKSLAALSVLAQSSDYYGPFSASTVEQLLPLCQHENAEVALKARWVLWKGGFWQPGPQGTRATLLEMMAQASSPAEKRESLEELARYTAWTDDHALRDALLHQFRRPKASNEHRELLATMAYIGAFLPVESAATHAFALTNREPHRYKEMTLRLLLRLKADKRYGWMVLLAPQWNRSQWQRILKAMRFDPVGNLTPAAKRLLVQGLKPSQPAFVQMAAARALVHHKQKALLPLLLRLLKNADEHEYTVLIRLLGELGDARALPLLRAHFNKSKRRSPKWTLALARLRCKDSQIIPWLKQTLRRTKGLLWSAPEGLIEALVTQGHTALLHIAQPKLKYKVSTLLTAWRFQTKPTQAHLQALLSTIERTLEPDSHTRHSLRWLRRHRTKAMLPVLAKTLAARSKPPSGPLLRLLGALIRPSDLTTPKDTPVAMLLALTRAQTLGAPLRQSVQLLLQGALQTHTKGKAPPRWATKLPAITQLATELPLAQVATIGPQVGLCPQMGGYLQRKLSASKRPKERLKQLQQAAQALVTCAPSANTKDAAQALVWAKEAHSLTKSPSPSLMALLGRAYSLKRRWSRAIHMLLCALRQSKTIGQQKKISQHLQALLAQRKAQPPHPRAAPTKAKATTSQPSSRPVMRKRQPPPRRETSPPPKESTPTSRRSR